ncbi:MAG: hypothetical protein GXO79_08290 [Chlorobi bacterium]|nr:hypothetical protein [Chlorobiota bacterium]
MYSQKYSIDNGKIKKSGKIGLAYKLNNLSQLKKEHKEYKAIKKQQRADRKANRKKIKKIQTKATRKRMKNLQKSAKRINQNKPTEYLHQRIYKYMKLKIKSTVIQSKIQFKKGFSKIEGVFNNTNRINKRRKSYIIDNNNN